MHEPKQVEIEPHFNWKACDGCGQCFQESVERKEYLLKGEALEMDWVKASDAADAMSCFEGHGQERPLNVLVLFGSLRPTSYSKLLAMESAR